jgi:hypothetical protein
MPQPSYLQQIARRAGGLPALQPPRRFWRLESVDPVEPVPGTVPPGVGFTSTPNSAPRTVMSPEPPAHGTAQVEVETRETGTREMNVEWAQSVPRRRTEARAGTMPDTALATPPATARVEDLSVVSLSAAMAALPTSQAESAVPQPASAMSLRVNSSPDTADVPVQPDYALQPQAPRPALRLPLSPAVGSPAAHRGAPEAGDNFGHEDARAVEAWTRAGRAPVDLAGTWPQGALSPSARRRKPNVPARASLVETAASPARHQASAADHGGTTGQSGDRTLLPQTVMAPSPPAPRDLPTAEPPRTTLHIGSIEVQIVPPPAPPQVPSQSAVPRSTEMGNVAPLARGFTSSFGLRQG